MTTTFLTILGGLAAAGVGAWISYLLRQARPQVTPTSIRRTVDVIPHGSVVEPNSELLTTCSEHPYLESPPFEGIGKVDEHDYVSFLTRTQERVEDYVRVQLPAITERAQQLQMKLAADDFDGVAHIWIDTSARLWDYAEGAFVRDEYSLSAKPADDSGETAQLPGDGASNGRAPEECEVTTGSDGSILVFYPGFVLPLRFAPKPRPGKAGEKSRALAVRLAEAFAFREKPDLIKVFNFLSGVDRDIPRLEAINQRIAEELRLRTRLSITALISNAGDSPISISKQTCTVTLFLNSYKYSIQDDERGKSREQRGDIELEMNLVDRTGLPNPPLTIENAGVQSITAVYPTPLTGEALPEGGNLYELLESALQGAERSWQIRINAVAQRSASKTISSRKIPFRDVHSGDNSGGRPSSSSTDPQLDALSQWVAGQGREIAGIQADLAALRRDLTEMSDIRRAMVLGSADPSQTPEAHMSAVAPAENPDGEGDGSVGPDEVQPGD